MDKGKNIFRLDWFARIDYLCGKETTYTKHNDVTAKRLHMENLPNMPEHIFPFRVPLSLIDTGGVVYNGRYFDIYNQARDEHMRDCGYPYTRLNSEAECHLAVVDAAIQYKLPVFYDDLVEIVTGIDRIGSSSITFNQAMYKNGKELLCNRARFVMVCTSAGFTARKIPKDLILAHEKGPY